MIVSRRWGYLPITVLVITALVVAIGCRDDEPTPSHYRDLGEPGRTLVPVGSSWHSVGYRSNDTATWVDFRELGAEEEPEEGDDGDEAEGAGGYTSHIDAEVREFIAEYNEVSAERDFDEMLLYHIESQREQMKPLMDFAKNIMEKLDTLRETLEEKLPDAEERIAEAFAPMEKGYSQGMTVQSLTVNSPTEVTAMLPPGSPIPSYTFKYVDEEWAIEIPNLEALASMMPMLQMGMTQFDTMIQGVSSGAMPAETVLAQIEQLSKMAAMMQQQTGGGQGGDESADEETADDEADEEEADEDGD